jgi:hypothetical protein
MKAGISAGVNEFGEVVSARLMGRSDQCLRIKLPMADTYEEMEWCMLSWPHEGDHDYQDYQGRVNYGGVDATT